MNKLYSFSTAAVAAVVAALFMAFCATALAAEPAPRLIDSPYQALEASAVELLFNASGDVVGIRGEGCPGCPPTTILPAQGLVLEAGRGRLLQGHEAASLNGMPGVIHIYQPTGMAYRVSFPGVLMNGGDQQ